MLLWHRCFVKLAKIPILKFLLIFAPFSDISIFWLEMLKLWRRRNSLNILCSAKKFLQLWTFQLNIYKTGDHLGFYSCPNKRGCEILFQCLTVSHFPGDILKDFSALSSSGLWSQFVLRSLEVLLLKTLTKMIDLIGLFFCYQGLRDYKSSISLVL